MKDLCGFQQNRVATTRPTSMPPGYLLLGRYVRHVDSRYLRICYMYSSCKEIISSPSISFGDMHKGGGDCRLSRWGKFSTLIGDNNARRIDARITLVSLARKIK